MKGMKGISEVVLSIVVLALEKRDYYCILTLRDETHPASGDFVI